MAISKRIPSYIRRLIPRPVLLTYVDVSLFMEHLAECSHCSSDVNNPCLIGHSLILNAPLSTTLTPTIRSTLSMWPTEPPTITNWTVTKPSNRLSKEG